jgi:hypothetical protein
MTVGQYHEAIPLSEPTTAQLNLLVAKFKSYAVVEHSDFDSAILENLKASISAFELYTSHSLYFQRVTCFVTSVNGRWELPLLPCKDFDVKDSDNAVVVFTTAGKGSIKLVSTKPIKAAYTAGYDFDLILNSIQYANIRTGLFEYAKLLFIEEDSKMSEVEREKALEDVLKTRFKNLYWDAHCTTLI